MFVENQTIFTPLYARQPPIKQSDVLVSKSFIRQHIKKVFKVDVTEEALIEQLSPLGFAVLAALYNKKPDTLCKIYVASMIGDLQNIVRKIKLSPAGTRAVIIFQATDVDEVKHNYSRFHKTIIYVERQPDSIHILQADTTTFAWFEEFCYAVIKPMVVDVKATFYWQEHLKDPLFGLPLFLQHNFYQCGTLSFKLARAIAKNPELLSVLQVTERVSVSPTEERVRYKLPPSFAKLAENQAFRKKFCTLPGYEALAAHYARYPVKDVYASKFSTKYRMTVCKLIDETAPEEIDRQVNEVDAKNFMEITHAPAP